VTKSDPLLYLPTMFAACMLFQMIYVACVVLWLVFPDLKGHTVLIDIFPQFKLLDVGSFIYGLVMSAIYAWFVAVVYVFFYNLWPNFARLVLGKRAALQ
jgi:hypothetical protein